MNLKEVADLSWSQIFPEGTVQTAVPKESFIRTAYAQFAYETLMACYRVKQDEGFYEIPSYLLTSVEKEVVNNVMDISDLKVFKSLPMDVYLQNIGGLTCKCKYVKSSLNLSQLLCDDDSLDDAVRTYYPLGKTIQFPKGVHKSPLTIIYANMGDTLDDYVEVDEAIASLIRTKLNDIYLGKENPVDVTNNLNPNT